MAVLGIDLGPHHLRLLQGALSGDSLKVYEFAQEEILISAPGSIAQQLEGLVKRKRLQGSAAALILSGPGVVHRVLDFPPMPLGELAVVVEREIRTVGGIGEDAVFDWEVIEGTESVSITQVRVLVAIAPKAQVDAAKGLLDLCRLKPVLFTTAPLALLRSLRFVEGEKGGLHLVLYLSGEQGHLLGVKNGAWDLYREFSSRSSRGEAGGLLEEAIKEANRVLLYYRQRYGERGEADFFLGADKGLEALRTRVLEETGLQGDVVRPAPELDLSPLAQGAPIFRDLFPSFLIPLGLVVGAYLDAGINLTPKTLRKSFLRKTTLDFPLVRRPVLALVSLIVFLPVHLLLVRTERHYEKVLKERSSLYAQWLPAIQVAEESRAVREREKVLLLSIGSGRIAEPRWALLFKSLSRLVPPDLALQAMSVEKDRDKDKWRITLKGEVLSLDTYTAQQSFNRFYQALKRNPYLEEIELLPWTVSRLKVGGPETKNPEASPAQKAGEVKSADMQVQKTRIEFEMRGYAKET
jgi:Tfp pilus assembly PilM family ATPase